MCVGNEYNLWYCLVVLWLRHGNEGTIEFCHPHPQIIKRQDGIGNDSHKEDALQERPLPVGMSKQNSDKKLSHHAQKQHERLTCRSIQVDSPIPKRKEYHQQTEKFEIDLANSRSSECFDTFCRQGPFRQGVVGRQGAREGFHQGGKAREKGMYGRQQKDWIAGICL